MLLQKSHVLLKGYIYELSSRYTTTKITPLHIVLQTYIKIRFQRFIWYIFINSRIFRRKELGKLKGECPSKFSSYQFNLSNKLTKAVRHLDWRVCGMSVVLHKLYNTFKNTASFQYKAAVPCSTDLSTTTARPTMHLHPAHGWHLQGKWRTKSSFFITYKSLCIAWVHRALHKAVFTWEALQNEKTACSILVVDIRSIERWKKKLPFCDVKNKR